MKKYKFFILVIVLLFTVQYALAGDIGNSSGHAWIEKLGWIKMDGTGATPDYGVTVGSAALSGYAWSEKTGWINFDDSGSYYGVTNDGAGNLSGYAWSEKLGYISFDDASANDYYQVALTGYTDNTLEKSGTITLRTGTTLRTDISLNPGQIVGAVSIFDGYGWSEKGGYISFDDPGDIYRSQTEWQWSCGDSVYNSNDSITYSTVLALDGNCWLLSNLGTANIAAAYNDSSAYGAYYQWGRLADGHQISTSGTTGTNSPGDVPGHSDFITEGSSPYDWRDPQNDNLWQGVNGTNNPCPDGWRLPTQSEWTTLVSDEVITDYTTAYSSSLKLTAAGKRLRAGGSLLLQGSLGYYWSSSPYGTDAYYLYFYSSEVLPANNSSRADGFSARCLKD